MKKKKGFTLIELLAVIVILAIIALIAVPVIMNVLNKANKSAFKDTAYGIISAGELYFAEQQLETDGMSEDKEFTFPTNEIEIKGEVPVGTVLKVNTNGEVSLGMTNGRYCVTKAYYDKDVTITEDEECYFPGTFGYLTTTEDTCTAKGQICETNGKKVFTIQVNESETYDFNVISDDGKKVALMMNENLGDAVAWAGGSVGNNEGGPLTMLYRLNNDTSDWINIPAITSYTYNQTSLGVTSYSTYKKLEIINGETVVTSSRVNKTQTIPGITRARVLTYEEAMGLGCATESSQVDVCPSWLYSNLNLVNSAKAPLGYWLLTTYATSSYDRSYALYIANGNGHGDIVAANTNTDAYYGVRPIIELYK